MIPVNPPTPAQLAEYDQIHARYIRAIDKLIDTHRDIVGDYGDREAHVAALACYLHRRVGHGVVAEMLAIAIDRMTEKEEPAHV